MRAQDTLGEAAVRFTASLENPKAAKAGADKAVIRTQTVSIRPPMPRLRTESVTPLRGPATVDVQRNLYPFEAQGQASVGAMPVLALRSLIAKLDTYPYRITSYNVCYTKLLRAAWLLAPAQSRERYPDARPPCRTR